MQTDWEWDIQFWRVDDYMQRVTNKQWSEALLTKQDTILRQGRIRHLIAKSLGYGVVEVTLEPLPGEVT